MAEGPLTEPELRKRLGLHERFSLDFLDALAGLGMLTKDAGRYRYAPVAEHYLDRGRNTYMQQFLTAARAAPLPHTGARNRSVRPSQLDRE